MKIITSLPEKQLGHFGADVPRIGGSGHSEGRTIGVMSGLRELRVWQESVSLAGDVIRAVRQGMRRETKSVSESVMTSALSVASHVADGYARAAPAEQRESYLAAKRALVRLETELAVARHADLVPTGMLGDLSSRSALVTRLLTGYLAYLDRQLAEDATRPPPPARGGLAEGQAGAGPVSLDSVRAPS